MRVPEKAANVLERAGCENILQPTSLPVEECFRVQTRDRVTNSYWFCLRNINDIYMKAVQMEVWGRENAYRPAILGIPS